MVEKSETGKTYAHVWSSRLKDSVEITISDVTPESSRVKLEKEDGIYHGAVEITDTIQIAQLSGLGLHESSRKISPNFVRISEAARIYPEVGNLAKQLINNGLELKSLTEEFKVITYDPEKVIKTLQEFADHTSSVSEE